ncbi:MAG: hypothetical protein HY046_07790 [Acidobacteria bacterium]|nr:hypothetical protein [Acidobacteriota bacterium]
MLGLGLSVLCLRTISVEAQGSGATIESNVSLFTTMCALQAAGYGSELSTAGLNPVRARVRSEMLRVHGPAVDALRAFYRSRRSKSNSETLSRYISFALVTGPPPKFAFSVPMEQVPDDARQLEGFNEILAEFYREANIEPLWRAVQSQYDLEINKLRDPVGQIVFVTGGYLRAIVNPGKKQVFTVYVEPLVGGKTSVRSVLDRYSIVVNPATENPVEEIRHAYLHFVLDPLSLRYPAAVRSREPLLNLAAKAPRLSEEHKSDFSGFVAECLVKAVELRLKRMKPERLESALNEADRDGYVLVRPLHRELMKFEKSEPSMSIYFPELLAGINVVEETKRLERFEFASAETVPAETAENTAAEPTELEMWLQEGDRQIAANNSAQAQALFEKVLLKEPGMPRAVYGLALSNAMQRQTERAKALFRQLIENSLRIQTGPELVAWSHVYLGRIHDVEGKRELALSEYRAAIAVPGAPDNARQAAQKGLENVFGAAAKQPGS